MKIQKLLITLLLAFTLIFSSACGGGGNSSGNERPDGGIERPSDGEGGSSGEGSSGGGSNESGGDGGNGAVKPKKDYSALSSVDFVKELGVGWNLGNAFENNLSGYPDTEYGNAIVNELGFTSREAFCEVRNQQDIYRGATTQKTIDAVYEKGFRLVRIPVSWSNHMETNGIIRAEWLGRIKEVVDYVFKHEDMFAIINIMDTPNIGTYYLDDAHYEKTKSLVINVWEQVAEAFKDYDERLIFENLNEPLHSKLGWSMSPLTNKAEYKECIENLNEFNKLYVDIVRGQGSEHNKKRFLSVCGYGNIGYMTYDEGINAVAKFSLPSDEAEDKLIMNIHAYSPNGFAFGGDFAWDEKTDENSSSGIKAMFGAFGKNYTEKGVGVIVSEWGSVYKNAKGRETYREKHAYYFVKTAAQNGVCTVVWDNDSRSTSWSTEYFGLLNRHKASGLYDDMKNVSGVKYDNSALWFSEGVIENSWNGFAAGTKG